MLGWGVGPAHLPQYPAKKNSFCAEDAEGGPKKWCLQKDGKAWWGNPVGFGGFPYGPGVVTGGIGGKSVVKKNGLSGMKCLGHAKIQGLFTGPTSVSIWTKVLYASIGRVAAPSVAAGSKTFFF